MRGFSIFDFRFSIGVHRRGRRRQRALRQPEVLLYTRDGCHLCDDAQALLEKYGLEITLIDIDADPALRARYHDCVPVVVIDGKERFRGRVNEILLRRLLNSGAGGHNASAG